MRFAQVFFLHFSVFVFIDSHRRCVWWGEQGAVAARSPPSLAHTHSLSLSRSLYLCFSLTFNRKRSIVHAHPPRGYRRKNRVTNDAKVFARGVTRVFSRSARLEGWLHFRLITPYFPVDCMCGSGGTGGIAPGTGSVSFLCTTLSTPPKRVRRQSC